MPEACGTRAGREQSSNQRKGFTETDCAGSCTPRISSSIVDRNPRNPGG